MSGLFVKVPINLKLDNGVVVLELDSMCYLQLRLVAQSLNQKRDLISHLRIVEVRIV